ncbi:TetR/AcrR family transcriptional regulator [Rhodococcus sp. ACT016]|uniref:TetR/AcrR family transcriptional regulator n=1 Tax=Rhodococcus sp. ACT016 TaxID=3134808 RepID=UPI003D2DAC39
MSDKVRPLRADAARNRALVLETAYRSFATEGLSAAVDEIANRAGVGIGTVYRHFPTKNALFAAAVEHRLRQLVTAGRALLDSEDPGQALFGFVRAMATEWGAADRGLTQVLAGDEVDVDHVAVAESHFMDLLGELLAAAKQAGTVQPELTVREAKAVIVACQAVGTHTPDVADRVIGLLLDGIRPVVHDPC